MAMSSPPYDSLVLVEAHNIGVIASIAIVPKLLFVQTSVQAQPETQFRNPFSVVLPGCQWKIYFIQVDIFNPSKKFTRSNGIFEKPGKLDCKNCAENSV